jgi:hypothetical protein
MPDILRKFSKGHFHLRHITRFLSHSQHLLPLFGRFTGKCSPSGILILAETALRGKGQGVDDGIFKAPKFVVAFSTRSIAHDTDEKDDTNLIDAAIATSTISLDL